MKKVTKKQKVILTLGFVLIIIFNFRPALEQIEMKKVNLDNQSSSVGGSIYVQALTDIEITGQKTYANYDENYRVAKGSVVSLYFINNRFCRDQFSKQCFSKDKFRILSTNDDQELLNDYLNTNKDTSRSIKFIDLNQDSVEDLLFFQKYTSRSQGYFYTNFYSANKNNILWQIQSHSDDFPFSPQTEVEIIKYQNRPSIIILYNQDNFFKSYSFYQSVNGRYKIAHPNKSDWSLYWKNISLWTLIYRAIGGMMFIAVVVLLLPYIILIFGLLLLIKVVKLIKLKTRVV